MLLLEQGFKAIPSLRWNWVLLGLTSLKDSNRGRFFCRTSTTRRKCGLALSLNNRKEVLVLSLQELQTATFSQSASLRDFSHLYTGQYPQQPGYGFLIEALSLLRRIPQTAERYVSLSRSKFRACSCFWNTLTTTYRFTCGLPRQLTTLL